MNDEIIELTSCYSELVKVSDTARVPIAYYPITESQLLSLFTGIKKIRVELLTLNEDDETVFTEYVDKEYKKDKLGRVIKEMYDAISVLLSNEKAAASKDIHDGF